MDCDITEKQIIEIAKKLYYDYNDLFANRRDEWRKLKIDNHLLFENTLKWRKPLRLFIKKYGGQISDE